MSPKKSVPPSRRRYEESHPVISMRVEKGLYVRLKLMKEKTGKSVADVLREAVGGQLARGETAWEFGFEHGHSEAEKLYRVNFRCAYCGGSVPLTGAKAKAAAAKLMRENGWRHGECLEF